jgi:hypothetical protein
VIQNGIGNVIFIFGVILFILFQNHVFGLFFAVAFYYAGLSFITFSHVMAFNPSPKKPSISSSLSTGGFTKSQQQLQSKAQSQTIEFIKVVNNDSKEIEQKEGQQDNHIDEKHKNSGNSDTSLSSSD